MMVSFLNLEHVMQSEAKHPWRSFGRGATYATPSG